MSIRIHLAAPAGMGTRGATGRGEEASPRAGRLIPILLALYLTPALLAVLLVGAIGMLILAVARLVASIMGSPEARPRKPVEPGSSAS